MSSIHFIINFVLSLFLFSFNNQVQEQLQTLGPAWIAFQQCLIDCDEMLKRDKEKFKSGLLSSAEDFKKSVVSLEDEFLLRGPTSSKIAVNEALASIQAFSNQVDLLKNNETIIRKGLNIFKIEQQPSKALQNVEKDIGFLKQVSENMFVGIHTIL